MEEGDDNKGFKKFTHFFDNLWTILGMRELLSLLKKRELGEIRSVSEQKKTLFCFGILSSQSFYEDEHEMTKLPLAQLVKL